MQTVAIELEHSLKRPPEPDEILFKYEEEGLNTGNDVNGRRSRRVATQVGDHHALSRRSGAE